MGLSKKWHNLLWQNVIVFYTESGGISNSRSQIILPLDRYQVGHQVEFQVGTWSRYITDKFATICDYVINVVSLRIPHLTMIETALKWVIFEQKCYFRIKNQFWAVLNWANFKLFFTLRDIKSHLNLYFHSQNWWFIKNFIFFYENFEKFLKINQVGHLDK